MDARGVRLAGGGGRGVGVGRGGAGGGARAGCPGAAGFRQHRASRRPQRCGGGVAARWEGADRGGFDGSNFLQSAELFDPSTDAFTALAASGSSELQTTRAGAVAASLPGGKVLIAGGADSGGILQSAELFDPSTNTFTALAASGNSELQTARTGAVATALPGGRVLIAGGSTAAAICRARSCLIRTRTRSRRWRRLAAASCRPPARMRRRPRCQAGGC